MTTTEQTIEPGAASRHELEAMACVLEGRHGVHAADVAEFFAATHNHSDDTHRQRAWSQVADLVRIREIRRHAGYGR